MAAIDPRDFDGLWCLFSGFSLKIAASVTSSASYMNVGNGFDAGADSVVRFSTAYGNDDRGMVLGAGSQAVVNTTRSKGGLETQASPSVVTGMIFNLGSNVCGTVTTCF